MTLLQTLVILAVLALAAVTVKATLFAGTSYERAACRSNVKDAKWLLDHAPKVHNAAVTMLLILDTPHAVYPPARKLADCADAARVALIYADDLGAEARHKLKQIVQRADRIH